MISARTADGSVGELAGAFESAVQLEELRDVVFAHARLDLLHDVLVAFAGDVDHFSHDGDLCLGLDCSQVAEDCVEVSGVERVLLEPRVLCFFRHVVSNLSSEHEDVSGAPVHLDFELLLGDDARHVVVFRSRLDRHASLEDHLCLGQVLDDQGSFARVDVEQAVEVVDEGGAEDVEEVGFALGVFAGVAVRGHGELFVALHEDERVGLELVSESFSDALEEFVPVLEPVLGGDSGEFFEVLDRKLEHDCSL